MSFDKDAYRRYLMDDELTNILLDDKEFSDQMFDDAVDFVIKDFNDSEPTSITINSDSAPINLLYAGVTKYLLEAATHKYIRNKLAYAAGNVSVDDMNKDREYSSYANYYARLYNNLKQEKKLAENMGRTFRII